MGRTPNDDRSDSMNPNNPAYAASESNRANQIGANYDDSDDDDDSPGRSTRSSFSYYSQPIEPVSPPRVAETEVIIATRPVRVQGLYLLIVSNDEKRKCITVDTGVIEEAVDDAKTIWDSRPLAYLALYDKQNIYFEQSRSKQFSPDVLRAIVALGELEKLISFASGRTSAARRSLDSDTGSREVQQTVDRFLERYGACYSALQGLRAERSERIEELRAKGCSVTEESAREFGQEGKLTQAVDAGAQWVRDFQSGKVRLDPFASVFSRPERILDVKA